MSDEPPIKSAGELGAWLTDTEFEFFDPIELAPGMICKRVDISQLMALNDGVTPDEIIEAMGNRMGEPIPLTEEEMVPLTCPDCGRQGSLPREVFEQVREMDAQVRCPQCRKAAQN